MKLIILESQKNKFFRKGHSWNNLHELKKKKEIVRMTPNIMEIEWKKNEVKLKIEWERWKDIQNVKLDETIQIMECVVTILFSENDCGVTSHL